jgi:hypothetical protein
MAKNEDDALETVSKSVKNIVDISTILRTVYSTVAKKIRPDYRACAKDFRLLTKELTGYARNLQEFTTTFYYYSFHKQLDENIKSLMKLFERFGSKEPREWASHIKFRCGEIDYIYREKCESWIKNYYGSHVSKKKQSMAKSQLKKLTKIDAELVDVLTNNVIDPIKQFVERTDKALRENPPNIVKAESAHRKLRKTMKPVVDKIDDLNTKLEDAAINFERVARTK